MQKLKNKSKQKRKQDEEAARQAVQRLQSMLIERTKVKLNLKQLAMEKEKDAEPNAGILAALAPDDVSVLTVTPQDGLKERTYKVYCGYNIEADRFFHQVYSTHIVIREDLFDEDLPSSQYAESVEYQGYLSGDDSQCCISESSALVYMGAD
mmetsp:Transcript_6250/g.7464  ORF Transcript_6250/g.7464 Transcript_6250/m.7464 type:complete len:152 (+) Transcript_6250:297-752(+)|eukprot:CAMPEP_0170458172 /NCGR_PEP_ID=MMETSP0123-20130129/5220_1 /TAXON_ID=182087 /ORGANISM="Favella ehrenbergii, Strain Fehren 1" /LENGTH=151 /DNA_ID=CAMNT_0010722211 /DNA_START=247 /DNA_END=702 /DNA_ORIENTATION=-